MPSMMVEPELLGWVLFVVPPAPVLAKAPSVVVNGAAAMAALIVPQEPRTTLPSHTIPPPTASAAAIAVDQERPAGDGLDRVDRLRPETSRR